MKKYGLVGERLSHSLSPAIHKRIFELSPFDARYDLYELTKIEASNIGRFIRENGLSGVNVTIPYKELVIGGLDELSPTAGRLLAVNTVLFDKDRLRGFNTDYFGFAALLSFEGIDARGKKSAVLGSGGASRAVCACLLDAGVESLAIVSRRSAAIAQNDPRVSVVGYDELSGFSGDILINTTPVGMYPRAGVSPVAQDVVSAFGLVCDIIYNPRETELLKTAKRLGKKTAGGFVMLVAQALGAQEIWRGETLDPALVGLITAELTETGQTGEARHGL